MNTASVPLDRGNVDKVRPEVHRIVIHGSKNRQPSASVTRKPLREVNRNLHRGETGPKQNKEN